ncbi:MAG: hypothetical protein ACKPJO_13945, partial [Dolichospermum sp.]
MRPSTRLVVLGKKLWTPAQISTDLWLDAADASTITLNGSTVSQWNDKSGNGRDATQATASLQPTYANNALIFTADGLSVPTSAFPNTSNNSVAVVMQATDTPVSLAGLVNIQSSPADNPEIRLGVGVDARIYYNGQYAIIINAGLTTQKISVLEMTPGVKSELFTDGTSIASGTIAVALSPTNEFTLGRYSGINATRNGTINEVLVYPSNTINRQLIEGYLAWKWGLVANLLLNHPFK